MKRPRETNSKNLGRIRLPIIVQSKGILPIDEKPVNAFPLLQFPSRRKNPKDVKITHDQNKVQNGN